MRGRVLEPCNVSVTMASTAGSGDVMLEVTKLKLNISVDVLELVLSLQSSVLDPLVQPSPDKCVAAHPQTLSRIAHAQAHSSSSSRRQQGAWHSNSCATVTQCCTVLHGNADVLHHSGRCRVC